MANYHKNYTKMPSTSGFSDRNLGLLDWMGEQYAARMDHLEDLAGIGKVSALAITRQMRLAGLVTSEWILVGQPTWAIPTAAGLRVSGLPYDVWTPSLGRLAHVGAVADVRVHLQAQRSDSHWISERQLELEFAKDSRRGRHTPDGVLILEGRELAIEVELNPKSPSTVEAVLNHHSRRFDAIMYYCAPQTMRLLTRLEATGRWPKLGVRELPLPRYQRER